MEVYCRIYPREYSFTATHEGIVKHDFRPYIRQYDSQMNILKMVINTGASLVFTVCHKVKSLNGNYKGFMRKLQVHDHFPILIPL